MRTGPCVSQEETYSPLCTYSSTDGTGLLRTPFLRILLLLAWWLHDTVPQQFSMNKEGILQSLME